MPEGSMRTTAQDEGYYFATDYVLHPAGPLLTSYYGPHFVHFKPDCDAYKGTRWIDLYDLIDFFKLAAYRVSADFEHTSRVAYPAPLKAICVNCIWTGGSQAFWV